MQPSYLTPTPIVATGTVTNPDGVPANYAITDPAAVPAVSHELNYTMQAAVEASYPNSRIGAVVNVDGSGIDDEINSIDLDFTVDKSWIDENSGVGNVKVLHVKDDGTIEALPATPRTLATKHMSVVTVSGRSFSAFILIVEPPTAVPTAASTPVRTASPIYFGGGGSTPFVQSSSSYRVPDDSTRIDVNRTVVCCRKQPRKSCHRVSEGRNGRSADSDIGDNIHSNHRSPNRGNHSADDCANVSPTPEKASGGLSKLSDFLGTWFLRLDEHVIILRIRWIQQTFVKCNIIAIYIFDVLYSLNYFWIKAISLYYV